MSDTGSVNAPRSRTWRKVKHFLMAIAVATGSLSTPLAASPAQAADGFTCSGAGTFFRVADDGRGSMTVRRYSTPGTSGGEWLAGTNPPPSVGWHGYGRLLGGPDGRVYGINSQGLHRHRWTGSGWASGDQETWRMSTGFTQFATAANRDKITVDESGDFYLIDANGALRWYRYVESTKSWAFSGRLIDSGWNKYNLLVATSPGVLYARDANGQLYRYRFDPVGQRWIDRDRLVGGTGFAGFTKGLFTAGGDTLFGVRSNGELHQFRYREDILNWELTYNRIGTGWDTTIASFATTNTCRQSAVSNPLPSTPVQPDAPIAVLQAPAVNSAVGTLEVAYADNIGQLRHGRVDPNSLWSIQWSAVPGVEAYTGKPALAADAQNRMNVFAHETGSHIAQLTQKTPAMPDWEPWFGLAGAMKSEPTVVRLADNSLVIFASDAAGLLWHRRLNSDGTHPLPWTSLGGTQLTGTPIVHAGADGTATILGVNAAGEVVTATWRAGALTTAWVSLGGTGYLGTPTATVLPGRRMMVLARHGDGAVRAQLQNSDGTWPRTWTAVGDGSITLAGSPSALLSPSTGRVWVFVRATDGSIYRSRQTLAGSTTWTSWGPVASGETYVADPTAFTWQNSGGQQIGFVTRTVNSSVRLYAGDETIDTAAVRASRTAAGDAFTRHDLPAPPER
ncbi:tachylectin-related carbohydrate-binding protein [Micromonospora sp. NPDC003241]